MKARVDRDKLSTELKKYTVDLHESDQALYDLGLQSMALNRALYNTEDKQDAHLLDGLLNMLDSVRDQIAEQLAAQGGDDDCVFPFSEEDERAIYEVKYPNPED